MEIQRENTSSFFCNPNGMSSDQRKKYAVLMRTLDFPHRTRTELSDGYIFALPRTSQTIADAAEWITYEMLCCPFLSFSMEVAAKQETVHVGLHGPEGIKPFLRSEFELA